MPSITMYELLGCTSRGKVLVTELQEGMHLCSSYIGSAPKLVLRGAFSGLVAPSLQVKLMSVAAVAGSNLHRGCKLLSDNVELSNQLFTNALFEAIGV